ncbi:MAG TPA: class I SAM-dependent methyltransferase [Azospirillum sp.]|nr:class I SAM-dependent methyltransferase [Azospirillum sp.]
MNHDVPDRDGAILYYDGDYPSLEIGEPRAEDVARLARIGILGDVAFYKEQAARTGGPVLEIGCGTGRLTIPLARMGLEVTALDASPAMLEQLRAKLAAEPAEVRARVDLVQADASALSLARRDFALAALPFNVLMLIADFDAERRTLAGVAAHLAPGGRLALDVMNPLTLALEADNRPVPSEARRNPLTGNPYVKNSRNTRLDEHQRQRVHGWYDELLPDGERTICDFSFHWRLIFRWELELMLAEAGLTPTRVAGDFEDADWGVDSARTVVSAARTVQRR